MSRIARSILLFLTLPGLAWAATSLESLHAHAASPQVINVGGEIDREGWLGFSVYARNNTLPPYENLRRIRPGRLKESLYVDPGYGGGTYEVAVWDQKVMRGQCRVKDCKYCPKYGYHLATMRAYTKGSLPSGH